VTFSQPPDAAITPRRPICGVCAGLATVNDLARQGGTQAARSDAVASREAIVAAAMRLYRAGGPEVTYGEIAHGAGVARATLYRHFPSRDELVAEIMSRLVDAAEAAAAAIPPGPDAFFVVFDTMLRQQKRNAVFSDLVPNRHALPPLLRNNRRRLVAIFAEPLAAAQAAGRVCDDLDAGEVWMLQLMLNPVLRPGTAQNSHCAVSGCGCVGRRCGGGLRRRQPRNHQ
jgi:AcrR family transcriptional regulator